jgi:hypothetical protein
MDLSIVSGTFNRIEYLKKMVYSVRKSIKYNLSYEIVLVDGGSTDGTQQWCARQDDIRLIQHESLLGAVKAFNDGAMAAIGDYVILANDDIEFVEDSIYQAWLWMQKNPECGMGCFYQDRDGRDWHVNGMPVARNGKQAWDFYGQVCIVPRWLGNECHWWGNYLHTYGGDNELASQIYTRGFKIQPIGSEGNPLAKIHDYEAMDRLREMNNIKGAKDPRSKGGHHPDSYAWGKRWEDKKTRLTGPTIIDNITIPNMNPEIARERIIYLPIYEQGWDIQKEQKRGLREALQRVGFCAEFDYVGQFHQLGKDKMIKNFSHLLNEVSPTLVLTQLHNGANISSHDIRRLRGLTPHAKWVNWNGDYWPENLLTPDGKELAKSFDLMTSVNLDAVEKYQQEGVNAQYWQIGFEPAGRTSEINEQSYDVAFLASGYSPDRQKFVRFLRSVRSFSLGLYGSGWPDNWSLGQNLYNFHEAAKVYRASKLALGDSQWPNSGFVSNRIFQILAAGNTALCHQWFRGIENLGLYDGQTCIIWQDFNDLEQKIIYYLANENERKQIADRGEKLALERHSFNARVRELFGMLRPQNEVDWRRW